MNHRVQLNGLRFVIHNEVLNFYDWVLYYCQPFHDIIKRKIIRGHSKSAFIKEERGGSLKSEQKGTRGGGS